MGRLARRLGVSSAVVACLALTVALPSGAGAASTGARAQQPADDVEIRGTNQTSWVGRDGTWSLGLDVTGAPPGAQVEATLHPRLEDREDFNLALFGVVEGDRRAGVPPVPLDDAPTSVTGGRDVDLAISLLKDGGNPGPGWAYLSAGLRVGVHPVMVRVVDADGAELARTVTFLTRVPSGDEPAADDDPLLVAPVVALDLPAASEAPAGDGEAAAGDGDDTTTTTDDDPGATEPSAPTETTAADDPGAAEEPEEEEVAPDDDPTTLEPAQLVDGAARAALVSGGLLASPELPATLLPRPRLVEAMGADPDTRPALRALRRAGRGRQVVDATFVEVAVPAWVSAGLSEELTRQREWGNAALTQGLGLVDSSTWDASSGLTPEALGELWPVGIRSAILPSRSVDGASALRPFTLSAGATRTVRAVEVHESLSQALVRKPDDPILSEGAFAAELAFTASETEDPAGVVVEPPPTWPGDEAAVARLSEILVDPLAPVRPVTVNQLLDEIDPSGVATLRPPAPVDLGPWPERLGLARSRITSYASMTGDDTDEVAELDRRLLVSGDVALTTDQRVHQADLVLATLDTGFAAIEAPERQTITLTARDGSLPFTLRNLGSTPATVAIVLDSDRRVDLPDGARVVVELQPGTNQIEIPVHTRVPGDSPIDITVSTPDGEVVLDEVRYTVRSTAVSGIGLILSIGAAAFLVLWWARHWTRSRRARHRPSHPSAGGGPGTGATDGPDGGEDGDGATADAPQDDRVDAATAATPSAPADEHRPA